MTHSCRFCSAALQHVVVDLGSSPIANDYLDEATLQQMEPFYPLCVYVCEHCFLVQLPEIQKRERIFNERYAYFSSYSSSWLSHAQDYVQMMRTRFGYDESSQVVELASNDGYLLQFFKDAGVSVLGVEPSSNVAEAAEAKGIPSIVQFFGVDTAMRLRAAPGPADLIVTNNVLAHVPDINDFVAGIKALLASQGVVTIEFPHLLQLMALNQFDTIYHEHYSYLSFGVVERIFAHHGLTLFDVEELSTHGGSLRLFARHQADESKPISDRAVQMREREEALGFNRLDHYCHFGARVEQTKRDLLAFLIAEKAKGKRIVGYGAPAKGNTLLNYCGIRRDFLEYTVDLSPSKQGKYLPGTRIPVFSPEKIRETKPDYILILPWNLKSEIMSRMADVAQWGGKFVTPIPTVEVHDPAAAQAAA